MKTNAVILAIIIFWLNSNLFAHGQGDFDINVEFDESAVGVVNFPTSCSDEVETSFNRAIALLHSFWFDAAIANFEAVLKQDPECAMAEWGKAMAYWGNPLVHGRAKEMLKKGAEAANRARQLVAGDKRERAYIEAVEFLYIDYQTTDDKFRARAFEQAMAKLVKDNPEDTEAAIFYAMSLNGTANLSDKTYKQSLQAAEILNPIFEQQPNHPGIAHYIIHSYDVPKLAQHALPAARKYASIAPAAPHALHMPSHTFTRLGYWQESIDTNLKSEKAALEAGSPAEALHALDYMVYAYMQTAQDESAAHAIERADNLFKLVDKKDRYLVAGAYANAAVHARYAIERNDWKAAVSVPKVKSSAPFVDAITDFARGLGAARSNDIKLAKASITNMQNAEHKLRNKNAYWADRVAINRWVVEGWTHFAEGDTEAALKAMNAGILLANKTEQSAVSPGPFATVGEQLGDMYLLLNIPEEALAAFIASTNSIPNRFRSLYGAASTAEQLGLTELAKKYYVQLVNNCNKGNEARPELVAARNFIANN